MPGKKGQKGWNKREEFDWRDLIKENKTLLHNLAKRFRIDADDLTDEKLDQIFSDPRKAKLFFKSLDIATAICVKSMPTKLEGTGDDGEILIKVVKSESGKNGSHIQAPRFAVPDLQ